VVDRDTMPTVMGQHRRGVPHGRHLHGLLPRGLEVHEELFPGLITELIAHGARLEISWLTAAGSYPATSCGELRLVTERWPQADRFWRITFGRGYAR
jgi:hypothetical protein